jgi:dihydrofolate synthase/folylpolyglutamate synthase
MKHRSQTGAIAVLVALLLPALMGLMALAIDMGLARVKTVADRMGLKFDCPIITVAGTNGKGSTCAMLEAILLEAGYRTGVYTSPHLVDFEERCRVRGDAVAAERRCAAEGAGRRYRDGSGVR